MQTGTGNGHQSGGPAQGPSRGISGAEVAALGLGVLWILGAGAFFLFVSDSIEASFDRLQFILTLVVLFLPASVLWVAVVTARSSRIYREETERLRDAIENMRQSFLAEREARLKRLEPEVEKKLDQIAQATQKTETVLATFTSSRQAGRTVLPLPKVVVADDQPSLALGTPAEDMNPPLSNADIIRAIHFPESETDTEGFAALRAALRDRQARQLVQASQDVLTLLSQDGIYMDDMRPDRARPEIWRRFAKGERGKTVAALGGIRDRSSLALTAARMKNDTIFRDAAHHFLRRFDQLLVAFEQTATDEEIVAMSETRTARAFMLLGRVTGAFT